ncbi:MAG: hypothetical protein U5P41_04390 [Gammaproteobacteria bacterium]|nr:hypothetical protein [Gammaproteobacteria bacterium]
MILLRPLIIDSNDAWRETLDNSMQSIDKLSDTLQKQQWIHEPDISPDR